MSAIVQSVWIGERLSTMERLCIRSFQSHGHKFHLYTYHDVEGVPPGTEVKDARLVMDYIPSCAHPVYFSDLFRYRMLHKFGGWYVDMDTVCLKPFDFDIDYVLAGEYNPEPPAIRVNTNVIKCPTDSPLMEFLIEKCIAFDMSKWQQPSTGPEPMTELVSNSEFEKYVVPPSVFNPIPHTKVPDFVNSYKEDWNLDEAYALHLWRSGWIQRGYDLDDHFIPGCLYERLKEKYL